MNADGEVTHERVRLRQPRVSTREIERQRELGWPDFHPEDYCHRCGGPNVCWWAPSPLWETATQQLRRGTAEIMCIPCFTGICEVIGVASNWRITLDPVADGACWKVDAVNVDARKMLTYGSDGRIFDWETGLYEGNAYGGDE